MFRENKILTIVLLLFVFFQIVEADASFWNRDKEPNYSLAVIPFENKSGSVLLNGFELRASKILIEFLHKKSKFKLIEMEKLGEILGEPSILSHNVIKNRNHYIDTVKSIGADFLLFGSILKAKEFRHKKNKIMEVVIESRVVRPLNGEIICIETIIEKTKMPLDHIYSKEDLAFSLTKALKKMSKKIVKGCRKI